MMTDRNFKKELFHSIYYDMENGNDSETIDYDCLIDIIAEFCDRIESLESEVKILNRKLTDDNFEVIKND
jgi:hypothetical protein